MRILFLGTPACAAIPLRGLAAAGYTLAGVVTQPDRAMGRSGTPQPPPVKTAALALGLPVLQPETLRDPAWAERLAALQPDIAVIAAYGEILRQRVLAIPPLGFLNIHPSLLPRHRGPAPVAGAILAGDAETGVTIMRLSREMDAGPILVQAAIPLRPDARAGPLTDELFQLGTRLLLSVLPAYASGALIPQEQDHSRATVTRMLQKTHGQIDWTQPAVQIERMTRAYDPWPGATATWRGQPLRILTARALPGPVPAAPGQLLASDPPRVATGDGILELLEVQPAGKRPMLASTWLRGARPRPDEGFAAPSAG